MAKATEEAQEQKTKRAYKIGHKCMYCQNDLLSNEEYEESADRHGFVHTGFCAHQDRLRIKR